MNNHRSWANERVGTHPLTSTKIDPTGVFGRVGPGMAEGARGAPQEVSDADTHCGLNVDAGKAGA